MATSSSGLAPITPHGNPVHGLVLGTSRQERGRPLQVRAAHARTIGSDVAFQERMFYARNSAHAAKRLHGQESESFNCFLNK